MSTEPAMKLHTGDLHPYSAKVPAEMDRGMKARLDGTE